MFCFVLDCFLFYIMNHFINSYFFEKRLEKNCYNPIKIKNNVANEKNSCEKGKKMFI